MASQTSGGGAQGRLDSAAAACKTRMAGEQIPELVIRNFLRLLDQVASGATGIIHEEEIAPVDNPPTYSDLAKDTAFRQAGEKVLSKLAVCKLNGGLGTSMGLRGAKSLLPVKAGMSFNDINAAQVTVLAQRSNTRLWFLNMTSFSTHDDVVHAFEKVEALEKGFFQQHKHPKVLVSDLHPAAASNDDLNWNPPGHGDLYPALVTSGMLERMLKSGIDYLFVSNSDNSAASPDPAILGYIHMRRIPFLMEVTRRTPADRKGGHLARRKQSGRLILREGAQAPDNGKGEPSNEFQDIERYRYFNTNSLWISLGALREQLDEQGGILPLPLIRNAKTLDPRDSESPKVYQLETAMGAAIELFDGAQALDVPRSRFMPVKTNSDLLLLRSDVFELTEYGTLHAVVDALPHVDLDANYKMIDDFEARFRTIPSLKQAAKFEVRGNVLFNRPLEIRGSAVVLDQRSDCSGPAEVPSSVTGLSDEMLVLHDHGFRIEPLSCD